MTVRVNYDGRIFQPVLQRATGATDATGLPAPEETAGDVGPDTRFRYYQQGDVVWATYSGGRVRIGTLIATVDTEGGLDARYQQIAEDGSIKTGRCRSTPEFLPDGRLRLHEEWSWIEGATGSGTTIVEEL